ncbi:hypothetical protein lerEdw1_006912 [Lerista edwardsae]|nr:hypothetical protein lerEdw1_006912 [Lerista edwardsae]
MSDFWTSKECDESTSSSDSPRVYSYRHEIFEFAVSKPIPLSSYFPMAISANNPMDEETPAISPWPDKTTVKKAIDVSAKEAENAKKEEEQFVMPPTSLVLPATEDLAKEAENAEKEEEVLVMPSTSLVLPATEDLAKEAENAKKEEEVLVKTETETGLLPQLTEEPPQPTLEEEENEEKETPAPQLASEEETKLPPSTPEELLVPQPSPEEQTDLQLPEENVSQLQLLEESPVVTAEELLQEQLFLSVYAEEQPEERAGWYYCLPERDLPVVQPPPLEQWPLSEPPPLTEATLPQPELFREPVVPPSSSFKEPTAPPIKVPFVPELALKKAAKEGSAAPVLVCTRPQRVDPVQGRKTTADDSLEDLSLLSGQTGNAPQSALANSIDSFIQSSVGQVFATTIDRALEKSEEWLDYFLPLIDTKDDYYKGAEEKCDECSEDLSKEGCFMRINSLSSRVRDRAFKLALHQLKMMRQNTNEKLSLLDHTLYLLEHPNALSLSNVSEQLQNVWTELNSPQHQEALSTGRSSRSASVVPEQLELKALELTKILAQQLHSTYQSLLPHLADLPAHLQDKVIQIYEGMEEMQSHFSSSALKDLPASFALQCRQKLASARETLDELLDFIVSNPQGRSSQLISSNTGKQLLSLATDLQTKRTAPESKVKGESSMSQQPALPPPQP